VTKSVTYIGAVVVVLVGGHALNVVALALVAITVLLDGDLRVRHLFDWWRLRWFT